MTVVRITLPHGMQALDWTDQVTLDLDPYCPATKLADPAEWQNWAVQFLNNTALGRNVPNPYNFDDWREWAERFVQALA